jgi:hypothetical protein
MTPDEAIEQAQLMIRWAESVQAGKPITIQCRNRWNSLPKRCSSDAGWYVCTDPPVWNFYLGEYRERPREPRRWTIATKHDGHYHVCWTPRQCKSDGYEIVEVVEVIHES